MEDSEENEIKRKRQKSEASKEEQEEENSELPSLILSLSSSSSSNLPQPNLSSPLNSSLTGFSPPLSSSSSSSVLNYRHSPSMQALLSQAFSQTPLQLSPTHALFSPSDPPLIPNNITHPSPSPSPSPWLSPLTSAPAFIRSPLPSESPLFPNSTTHPSTSSNSSLNLNLSLLTSQSSYISSSRLSELPLLPGATTHSSTSPSASPSSSSNPSQLTSWPLCIPSPVLLESPLILNTTTTRPSPNSSPIPLTSWPLYIPSPNTTTANSSPSPSPSPNQLMSPPLYISSPALSESPIIPNTRTITRPSPGPSTSRVTRSRRNQSKASNGAPKGEKSETIPIPFPWATNRRAIVHSLAYLKENKILTITGRVQCRTCENSYEVGFDLQEKFAEIASYIARNDCILHNRAREKWLSPKLPTCRNCGNSVRPVVSEKKRSINWLFMLLGQMLGCLTLDQLKYFLKHTNSFRTGAKDRIVYSTYLGLCKQLDPTGPFDCLFDYS